MATQRGVAPVKALTLCTTIVILFTSLATTHASWPPTPDELKLYASSCTKTDSPMKLTHWSSIPQGMRWANAGKVEQGEIDFLASNDQGQAMGGGLYLAEDTTSSKGFGPFPTFFDIPAGVCLYRASEVQYAFGVSLDVQQRKDLGRWVPQGVMWEHPQQRAPQRWFATTSGILASKVTGGDLNGVEINWPALTHETIVENFVRQLDDDPNRPYTDAIKYLKSLFNLWTYFDGIAFLRAIRTTSNPFNEFEPQNFPAYNNARDQLHTAMYSGQNIAPELSNWRLGDYSTGIAALKYLYNQIAGNQPGTALPYRTNVVRAGGSTMINGQGYFEVTPKQKQMLIDNPYLTVEEAPGQPLMVAYYYPDATHYAGIEKKGGVLDAQLLADLKAGSSDPSQQGPLTARIVEACVKFVMQDRSTRLTSVGTVLALDLVAIHPWGDMNGRTTRLYAEFVELKLQGVQGPLNTANPFIGDFDLVTPVSTWVKITDRGGVDVTIAKAAMAKELVRALAARRMPDYFPLREIEDWAANSFASYGVATVDTNKFTPAQWEMVRQRQFVAFMKQLNPSFENAWVSHSGMDSMTNKARRSRSSSRSTSGGGWSMASTLLVAGVGISALAAVSALVVVALRRRGRHQFVASGLETLLPAAELSQSTR